MLKNAYHRLRQIGKTKIFCISMQRSGTTSFGDFLADHGVRTARDWHARASNWHFHVDVGNHEAIFKSNVFRSFQGYEDGPWWYPDFYRVLFHRFPDARFVHMSRSEDAWFDSMVSHSDGRTLGNTRRHCRIYRRMDEFYRRLDDDPSFKPSLDQIDNLMEIREDNRAHYIALYRQYNREVRDFFQEMGPERLYSASLEDENKWHDIGAFLELDVEPGYRVHSNKTSG